MGKPWKKRSDRTVVPEVTSDYKWSSQSYKLKAILANFKLPVVVQCREDTSAQHLQNFFFDLRQPIVLHSKRTTRKVFARCVRKGSEEGAAVKELLPEVVIPEDYAGWFKISKGLEFTKPAPHKSIETLTRSNAEFFLCTTEFNAIVMTESADINGGDCESFTRPVAEGEVLRKTGVQKLNPLLLPEPERSLTRDNRYLMCIDEKDCELFVPLTQTGLFYEVSSGDFDKNDNCVIQISDILDEMIEMPLYVRHILGDPPPISKMYLPTLKLVRVREEETVMGSTLESEEDALPLEIQTSSCIKFEIALNTPFLQACNEYTEAVGMCKNVGESYVTDMKLAVTFQTAPTELDDKPQQDGSVHLDDNEYQETVTSTTSRTTTGRDSELGEEGANSEFSIQWEPSKLNDTSDRQSNDTTRDADCDSLQSIESSVDSKQAAKLNTVLGGPFFDTDRKVIKTVSELPPDNVWRPGSYSDPESPTVPPLQLDKLHGFVMTPDEPVEMYPADDDIVEGITDFSMRVSPRDAESTLRTSSPTSVLPPPDSFADTTDSLPSTVTMHSSNTRSNISTDHRDNRQFDTKDSFLNLQPNVNITEHSSDQTLQARIPNDVSFSSTPSLQMIDHSVQLTSSSSNPSSARTMPSTESGMNMHVQSLDRGAGQPHKPYIFSGDVFMCQDSFGDLDGAPNGINSTDSMPDSVASWDSNRLKMFQSRDVPPINGRTHPTPDMANIHMDGMRSISLIDDLIDFDEYSKASPTNSTNSIITCKAADEMVTSCNDLRLSLEEITRSAHDNHEESSWQEFCLERSCSLPVRSKSTATKDKPMKESDEHSQSWEQISPRRGEDTSMLNHSPRERPSRVPKRKFRNLNGGLGVSSGDKTQLISDTSSEDSAQYSHHSCYDDNHSDADDTSFTLSVSESDLSVTDGPEEFVASLSELNVCMDRVNSDSSVTNATTLTRDKTALTQKIKIRHEIKRKQCADWNDNVDVI